MTQKNDDSLTIFLQREFKPLANAKKGGKLLCPAPVIMMSKKTKKKKN